MDKTQFAGLTRLNPGESLGVDGYSFQHINPSIIDRLLQIGAVDHRHDAHAALADPVDLPVVSEVLGGGQILANTTVWACYTLLDADGGETVPSTAQSITTPAPLDAPDDSPTVTLDTTAGGLLVNTYMYAVTLLDGNGGETTIGPAVNIQRPSGPANAQVQIAGLSSIATAAGATGWRLWRSVGGARWGYLATGDAATDTFTDNGATSLDCTQVPPPRNTTNAVNQVRVVVPNTQPAETVSFRIYLSEDGSFTSPALAGTYPIADAGTNKDFPVLSLADGQPPAVSLSIPGAAQINADTDVYGWTWKASVADFGSLPALGNANGDIRVARDTRIAYIWDTTDDAWHVALTGYLKSPVANAAALPALGNTVGDMRVTLDDYGLHVWGSDDAWHSVVGGGGEPPATTTLLGVVEMSVAPVDPANPIAVGTNDPRNSNARTPTAHAASHASGGSDSITIAESQVTGLAADLAAKAPLASPTLTGDPKAPTPAAGDNDTSIATTAFVQSEIAAGVGAPNVQTDADYSLVLADAGKTVEMASASAHVLTVPTNASQAFRLGAIIEVARMGAGAVTIAAAGGVTIRSRAGLLAVGDQYGSVSLRKRATDEWVLVGDLA